MGGILYNGIREYEFESDEDLAAFYENRFKIEMLRNQYLLIKKDGEYIDKFFWDGSKLQKVKWKPIESQLLDKIKPLNAKQELYFHLLEQNIPCISVSGVSGSGKSFLSTAWAVQELMRGKYNKLIVIRNNIGVENVGELGILPGDANEKLKIHVAFIGDIISDYAFDMLLTQNKIEVPYIGYLRSRSFSDSIILVNEAQNLNISHVYMILTRVAKNTRIIFDHDVDQIDRKILARDNGVEKMLDAFKGHKNFGAVEFDKIERSEVAQMAELLR
jgi:PhoH-like ATPase